VPDRPQEPGRARDTQPGRAPAAQATASFPRPPEWCRAPGEARAKSLLERFQQNWQRFCGSETRQHKDLEPMF